MSANKTESPVRRAPRVFAAAIAACLVLTAGALWVPKPPGLSESVTGDAELARQVRAALGDKASGFNNLSVAVIDGDDVRQVHFGALGDQVYEIGSVTKTMTGSLLQIAVERGEVELDTRLGELLELDGTPAGDITLEQLATHHSGLPRLSPGWKSLARAWWGNLRGVDPYRSTVEELVKDARNTTPGEQTYSYSNFGYALLGQALAAAADTDWETLVHERIHAPLVMDATTAHTSIDQLPADAPTGMSSQGRPQGPWTMGADAPAGNVRSTTEDMVAYVQRQMDGSAPGADAVEPRREADGERVGLSWMTGVDGAVWHNGGTGGFSSYVAFDPERKRGVVVLSNVASAGPVDDLGHALVRSP